MAASFQCLRVETGAPANRALTFPASVLPPRPPPLARSFPPRRGQRRAPSRAGRVRRGGQGRVGAAAAPSPARRSCRRADTSLSRSAAPRARGDDAALRTCPSGGRDTLGAAPAGPGRGWQVGGIAGGGGRRGVGSHPHNPVRPLPTTHPCGGCGVGRAPRGLRDRAAESSPSQCFGGARGCRVTPASLTVVTEGSITCLKNK